MKDQIEAGDPVVKTPTKTSPDIFRWLALFAVAAIITIAFLDMVAAFLVALFLAAIASVLLDPHYRFWLSKTGNRSGLASALMLLVVLVAGITPGIAIAYYAQKQAASMPDMEVLTQVLERATAGPDLASIPDWVPFRESFLDAGPQITEKVQELAGSLASFLASSLSGLAQGAATFFLNLFIFLYALVIFIQMDTPIIKQVLSFTGLRSKTQDLLFDRMVSISHATIKGGLLIGVAQGLLGGLGFWVTGIENAVFWAVVMMIASVIPPMGPAFVVVCGAIYLGLNGSVVPAIGLALWGVLVVGMIDNFLRPKLVGRSSQMNEIMTLIGTFGGLATFGATGLVLGPVLTGLFVAVWKTWSESVAEERALTVLEGQARLDVEGADIDQAEAKRTRVSDLSASRTD